MNYNEVVDKIFNLNLRVVYYARVSTDSLNQLLNHLENQNLNTYDANSELILNIIFNLTQEESKKLLARIKFGHNEAIKKVVF